jgi:nicotinamide-nucleotide amidase
MTATASPLIARLVAIGDELLFGRTVDTNSTHVSRFLTDRGLRVERTTVVGDGQAGIAAAMLAAADGAALVVCTGGLGPTEDDRTRHALASVMGVRLEPRPAAYRQTLAWYRANRPGVAVPASNRRQALMPRYAAMLANDRGTACGMLGRVGDCLVACLPGVPHEMEAMLDRLGERFPLLFPHLRAPTIGEIWFAGIGESAAQDRIDRLFTEHGPQVGITVSELGHLVLRVVGTPAQVGRRCAKLRRVLRPFLLPETGIAPSLVALLTRRRQIITCAESCTCGHVVAQLGAVPGASLVLRESLVAYHNEVKERRLGVDPALIRRHGAVSEPVAAAMAAGALARAGADFAVATSGIAGPDGGSKAKPVGTVCIAVADRRGTVTRTIHLSGTRERIQRRAAAGALGVVWEVVSGQTRTGGRTAGSQKS